MFNKVILVGRLVADPELRQTQSGVAYCRFRIAVDRRYKTKDGETQTDFINIQAWQKTAEFVCKYFSKGSPIIIDGELQNNNYEQNGVKHYSFVVNASSVGFAGSKNDGQGTRASQQNTTQIDDLQLGSLDDFEEIIGGDPPF